MSIFEDLKFAVRILTKRPWLTAMLVAVLAAGIGVNAIVFTLVDAVLIRGLPFEDGDRILYIEGDNLPKGQRETRVSYPDFEDFRAESKTFESLAAFLTYQVNLSDDATTPERFDAAELTPNAFGLLRVRPVIGRDFQAGDDQPGAEKVVLLGDGAWRNRYGADPAIVGKTVRIDEIPCTVIGVMPPGFRFPVEADLWTPLVAEGDVLKRDVRRLSLFGRLAPEATLADARVELEQLAGRLRTQYPDTNEGQGAVVMTFNDNYNGGDVRDIFLAMSGAVGFVLLIACANVTNVQLTRAAERSREISIRTALGAQRGRIVRQLMIESIVLAALGGLVGFVFSGLGIRAFDIATRPFRPYWIDFSFNATVFGYLAAVCLGSGVLFGLAPAVHAVRTSVNESLKQGSRGQTGGAGSRRFSSMMVVGQIALSIVLLFGAGLLMRSFWNLYHLNLGVNTDNILTGDVSLPKSKYPGDAERRAFQEALMRRVRALPGVASATAASHLPGQGSSARAVEIEGKPEPDANKRPNELAIFIDTGYFETLGAALLRGRAFSPTDTPDAPAAAVVNQAFAEKYWPGEDPLGKRMKIGDKGERPWVEVVGVSPNIRQSIAKELADRPILYLPYSQAPSSYRRLIVRGQVAAASLADPVRAAVAELDPYLPVYEIETLDERLDRSRWPYRVFGSVFLVFGAIAVILAAVGVYALVADSVRRRVPEFGIRLALGAEPTQILRLVLGHGLRRVAAGLAMGLPAAYFAARILNAMLVGVEPSDPLTLGSVAVFLLGVAVAACWIPARRAMRVDPGVALRDE